MCENHTALSRANKIATRTLLSPNKLFKLFRKSAVPEEGWNQENFTGKAKQRLRRDMLLIHRAAIRSKMRTLTPVLRRIMEGQVSRVIESVERSYTRLHGVPLSREKRESYINLPAHATLWQQAIESEFSRANLEVVTELTPAYQSVATNVSDKVSLLLGTTASPKQTRELGVRIKNLARKVTIINETTREKLQKVIAASISDNLTVFETIQRVREQVPSIAANRIPTIIRTEMGRASDEAMKNTMKNSEIVTHIDVIGCEKIEPNIPTFQGTPTCNIENVPIQYEQYLEFHINHTGCIVAGAFRKRDGSILDLEVR